MVRDKNTSNADAWSIVQRLLEASLVHRPSTGSTKQNTLYDSGLYVVRKFKKHKTIDVRLEKQADMLLEGQQDMRVVEHTDIRLRRIRIK
jgi:hypothetical protein